MIGGMKYKGRNDIHVTIRKIVHAQPISLILTFIFIICDQKFYLNTSFNCPQGRKHRAIMNRESGWFEIIFRQYRQGFSQSVLSTVSIS